ncbi:amino acid adenylation domain-containing protein [Bradyrhizobium sp.]|uniref:amino acid adenylation domain-containing protein n=1 Tax=Bradyrhizobium sp. TaxID=376 RepID=UPI003C1427B8
MQNLSLEGYRLSPQQERLWELQQSGPSGAYCTQAAVLIRGGADPERLRAALQRIVEHCEILRTTFHCVPGLTSAPLQVISQAGISWGPGHDLTGWQPEAAELKVDELLTRARADPFDLVQGPLVRAALLTLSRDELVLILTLPAICADALSIANVVRELGREYARQDGQIQPSPPAIQYADFCEWQKSLVESADQVAERRPWTQIDLAAAPAVAPADELSGQRSGCFNPQSVVGSFAPGEVSRIETAAENLGADSTILLLTCWLVLVSRLTGRPDPVLGFCCDGRKYDELKSAVGLYAKYIPLQFRLRGEESLPRAVQRLSKLIDEIDAVQEYFSWDQIDGATSLAPLCFEYQLESECFVAREVTFSLWKRRSCTEPFALKLSCGRRGDQMWTELHFDAGLYREQDVRRWTRSFQALVGRVLDAPELTVDEIDVVDDIERDQQLRGFNDTSTASADHRLIHQWFERQAERVPDRIAVALGDGALTYRELDVRSNQLARYLRARGAGAETLVALCVDESIEAIVGILGILKAGGAYVPLDPASPSSRLAAILEEAGAEILLTLTYLAKQLPPCSTNLICLDQWAAIGRERGDPVAASVEPDNLAYIIFTSGSSGPPKGVMVSHRNLVHSTHARDIYYQRKIVAYLLVSSIAFDSSVAGIFGTLCQAGTLVLGKWASAPNLLQLGNVIWEHQVSHTLMIPALLSHLLSEADAGTLSSLETVIVAGETCSADVASLHHRTLPRATLINEYGPTEGTVWATAFACPSRADGSQIPIGRPIANSQIYLLEKRLRPVPIGSAGEVHLGGDGVARGYIKRPEYSAECFLPDPFGAVPGARLYATGDLGRYGSDGNIVFLGRLDHQVKVRGIRVELLELEASLAMHPAVRECAVVARRDGSGQTRLTAYFVAHRGQRISEAELRTLLSESVMSSVIPDAFIAVNALPRTLNGKVDRAALPASSRAAPQAMPASTETEKMLAAIWCELLRIDSVGVRVSFFDLGGHSLMAITLMARIEKVFRVHLPLRSLFQTRTIEQLAQAIDQRVSAGNTEIASELLNLRPRPRERSKPFPLNPIQQAYWIGRHHAFELGNVGSTNYFEWEVESLDIEKFAGAIRALIARHDMLRAIVLPDGHIQVLDAVAPYELQVVDVRGMSPQGSERHLQAVRQRMSGQTLKTDRWPPFEIRAHRLEDRLRLHVCFDLVMFDAVSSNVLVQELHRLYHAPDQPLEALDITFRDYAIAERGLRESALYRRAQAYWTDHIPTLPAPPALPVARNPQEIARPRFVTLFGELDRETWERLKSRGASRALTSTGLLCAAYADILARWSKSRRFTLNLTTYHRIPFHPQVDRLVGDFTSLTMLDVDNNQETFELRAQSLQARLWSDLDHFYYSGVEVLRALRRQDRNSVSALMPIVFTSQLGVAVQDDPDARAWMGKLIYSSGQAPQVWLDHQVAEKAGRLSFWWDYLPDLFPDGLVQDMFQAYCRLLKRLADDGGYWQKRTRALVSDGRSQAGSVDREPAAAAPGELLHSAFLAQVHRRAGAAAIATSGRTLSYDELHRRSIAVACRLRSLHAPPSSLVAIVMEKGWEQVVAVLGVLQSGAAYLPVDPALPAERQRFILENAQVKIVLTQSWLEEKLQWPAAVERLWVDRLAPAEREADLPEVLVSPEQIAYVIYTSGSTGLPKGVIISHRAAVNTIGDVNRRFRVGRDDRVLAVSSLSFDLSVYDIFGPLSVGGTIVIPDADKPGDSGHWEALIREQSVTVWNSVPALLEMLVTRTIIGERILPPSLRLVLLSGDWLPVSLPARLRRVAEGVEIISLGGATEASIWSILYPIGEVRAEWKSIPYGRAMENQTVEVLDEFLKPCPAWVTGRIFIGGSGLSDGYWRDETKTSERFIIHPVTNRRLFHTGDLGRYLPDGNIEFLGREDFQVKIGGHRVELGEIEAVLEKHPAVSSAVVTAHGPQDGQRLIAYVVPRQDGGLAESPAMIPDAAPADGTALINGPLERLHFALQQPGIRRNNGTARVQLLKPERNAELIETYRGRRTHRVFGQQPLSFEQFSALLNNLMQVNVEESPFPKYRYASAGSLYSVQTYVCVKPLRVAGVSAGTYYYNPGEHRLELLSDAAQIPPDIYHPVNRAAANEAAFSLFLIGQLDAVTPMYGEAARDFCLLEAGYMSQLLMTAAASCGLGLCPIGGVDQAPLRDSFGLTKSHTFLHCLLGGVDDPTRKTGAAGRTGAAPMQEQPRADELRIFLKAKLPAYMLPAEFTFLEGLPLTSNGKVDRSALPAPKRTAIKEVFVAPVTSLEQLLADIWKELLGLEKVGLNDDFFRLGGNSLMAIQFINRVHQILDVEVPLKVFLGAVTIADLVPVIETQESRRASASLLDQLEQLSVEEARSMLEAKRAEAVQSGKARTPDQV